MTNKPKDMKQSTWDFALAQCKRNAGLIKHVADNGGELSYKTIKGKVQDVHYAPQRDRL